MSLLGSKAVSRCVFCPGETWLWCSKGLVSAWAREDGAEAPGDHVAERRREKRINFLLH